MPRADDPARSHVPAGRYGPPPSRGRRAAGLAALAALTAVALAWLLWAAWSHANPQVRGELVGYAVTSDAAVQVRFAVTRDPGARAVCVVRARNRAGVEVARAEVSVPPGEPRRRLVTHDLPTRDRAVLGEVETCRLVGR